MSLLVAGVLAGLVTTPAVRADGQIKVVYVPAKRALGKSVERAALKSGPASGYGKLAIALNSLFRLPRDVPVVFTECGFVNAFYAPEKHRIVMCYEMMEYFATLFARQGKSGAELGRLVGGATVFVFMHEFGHALVGELAIPTTGREEDAVDEFATLLLARLGNTGEQAVLSSAYWFNLESKKLAKGRVQDLRFWDEHSLNPQRFYDIVCLLYGSNQEKYASLITEVGIPPARGARCVRDYPKKQQGWNTLLAPHLERNFKL